MPVAVAVAVAVAAAVVVSVVAFAVVLVVCCLLSSVVVDAVVAGRLQGPPQGEYLVGAAGKAASVDRWHQDWVTFLGFLAVAEGSSHPSPEKRYPARVKRGSSAPRLNLHLCRQRP